MSLVKKIVAGLTAFATIATASPVLGVTAEELWAQIQQLQQQLNQLLQQYQQLTGQAPTGVPAACVSIAFDRDLRLGMSGNDVKCLQALLNQDPETRVAETGAGSPGNETTYFGPKTKAAVIKFQEKYKDEILTPAGLTAGTGYVGPKTRAKLNAILAAAPTVPTPPTPPAAVPAGLTVEIAPDTPAATVLMGKQVRAPLLKVNFTNGDNTAGKVTEISLKRLGISSDAVLEAVYLLDENGNRLGDEVTFSSGVATIKDPAGIFTVEAGAKKSVLVVGDVASGQAGFSVGVALTGVKGTFTALNATFPINGNIMSIATDVPTTVTIDSNDAKTTPVSVQAGKTDVVVWEGTITPSAKISLSALAFKGVGNIEPANIKNYRLYVAGSQVGSAVEMSSNYVVKFDLSAQPLELAAGAKTIKVLADVVGGTGRNVYLEAYLQETVTKDVQYGVNIAVTVASGGNFDWKTINITGASATLTVAPDSPVAVATTTDVLVAKFNLKVLGERVKFTDFYATSANATLTSVVIYVNGSQQTSATNIGTSTATKIVATPFYVDAGETAVVEVKADTTNYATGTIVLTLSVSGQSATQPTVTAGPVSVTVDVRPAALTVAFAGEPLDYLAVAGRTVDVAKFKFTARSADATIKELKFVLSGSPAADISGLKINLGGVDYDAEQENATWTVKNLAYTVSAGKTEYGMVKVTLRPVSSATDGRNAKVKLTAITYSQAGEEKTEDSLNIEGNDVLVYNGVPVVTALTTGTKTDLNRGLNGGVVLYEWKLGADGAAINSTSVTTTLSWGKSGATATTTVSTSSLALYKNGVKLTSGVTITADNINDENATTGTIVIKVSGDLLEVAAGSEITLTLKGDVIVEADSSYIRVRLLGDDDVYPTSGNFVWNDGIKEAISGLYVKGLPAEGTDWYQHNVSR